MATARTIRKCGRLESIAGSSGDWSRGRRGDSGAAILALFVPAMLAMPVLASRARSTGPIGLGAGATHRRDRRGDRDGAVVARNASVYGRFVPTALWMGASLYDGLNPGATGASDMRFWTIRSIWPLDEEDQDAELSRRAIAFARDQPARAFSLAIVKLGSYWTPWPNADVLRSPIVIVAGAIVELPVLGLMLLGAWDRRRDLCAGCCWPGRSSISGASPGFRQLDALSDSRRDTCLGAGGDRLDQTRGLA